MKILLAEDTMEIAQFVVDMLTTTNHSVDHAADGVSAQRLLKDNEYDLVICDHHMPRVFGNEVYDFLRRRLGKNTFFIHFSSMPCPEVYRDSSSDKNFKNIPKPHFDELGNFIEGLDEKVV